MDRSFLHFRFCVRLVGSVVCLFFLLGQAAWGERIGEVKKLKYKSEKASWVLIPGLNAGYNKLLEGYDGYEDLGNVGMDLYIQLPRATILPTRWYHKVLYRFSLDYFPLQVPEGNYGLEEDIYSLNFSLVYRFERHNKNSRYSWLPFAGLGMGWYRDEITLDTPASGKIKGTHNYSGFLGSFGVFAPEVVLYWPIRFTPEVRYHRMNVPEGKATNVTYQLGITLWFHRSE